MPFSTWLKVVYSMHSHREVFLLQRKCMKHFNNFRLANSKIEHGRCT